VTCNTPANFASAPTGVATPIEIAHNTTDPAIPVGKCPVYAVQTPDLQRLYVLNRGSDTITVINTSINALDSCTPFQNQNGQWITCHQTIQLPAGSGPVYAEYNAATQQLVVANYDGGTISVINV
jgi:DNA-binding beta-propeller fold protein YncE